MATVDSLDIQISASAKLASNSIDMLVSKIEKLSNALNGINTTNLSNSFKNISKSANGNMFKNFSDSAKNVENSMKKITKQAEKEIKVKATFDISDYQKVSSELGKKFADAGKDIKFYGNFSELEKQYQKLNTNLDKLSEKEKKVISVGKTSPESTIFRNLQYDISSTLNQLDTLSEKIKSLKTLQPEIKITREDTSIESQTKEASRKVKIPASSFNYSSEAMSKVFGENMKNVKNYEEYLQKLGTQGEATMNKIKASTENVSSKTNSLGNQVEELKSKLKSLSSQGLNFGDVEFDKIYSEFKKAEEELKNYKQQLEKSGDKAQETSNKSIKGFQGIKNAINSINGKGFQNLSFSNILKKSGNTLTWFSEKLKSIADSFKRTNMSSKGIISSFGKLFIAIQSLKGLNNIVKTMFTSALNYIEESNYFDVAVSKIAKENKNDYKKYGYEDADSYADSFSKRLKTLTTKLSGIKIKDGGEFTTSSKIKNLGLDVTEIMNFESRVAQMTNSVGMIGEASVAASKGLTMLAGDMSSLANVPLDQVMNNFSSALSGSAMAVKKYGMDTSVATLEQTALSIGVKKSISDMTQVEKQYLRVITMINQSKVAWGDLANTINQPANQLRMLKNNFKQVAMMIGKLFMPIVQKVLPWLNAMAIAIKDLVQWIGDLFGIKWDNSSIKAPDSSGWDDFDDSVSDVADSIDDATDKQKKFNKQLQAFDELNNLTTSDSDKDKDKDKNADVSGILSDALINAVEDYEKRWNKAFKNMRNEAEKLAQKIEEVFKKDWAIADFTDVGETLGKWIKKGLNKIPWNEIKKNAKKIGKSVGTLINGFIEVPGLGKTVGKAIANGIDTAVLGLTSFFTNVHWDSVGKFIADGVNSVFKSDLLPDVARLLAVKLNATFQTIGGFADEFDWDTTGETIVTSLNTFFETFSAEENGLSFGKFASGIASTLYTVVSDKNTWINLGEEIGNGIKGFFEGMNEIQEGNFGGKGMTGWEKLGKSISSGISGIATSITTALETIDWITVGQAIGDFISSIDFGEVVWNFVLMADSAFTAICDAVAGIVEKAPLETAIATLFTGLKLTGALDGISTALTESLATKGLTLGKVAIGLGLGLATFKLLDSESKVANYLLAPITAFTAGKTFGLSNKTSFGLTAALMSFKLLGSDSDIESKIIAPIALFVAGKTFGLTTPIAIAAAFAITAISWTIDVWGDIYKATREQTKNGTVFDEAMQMMADDIVSGDFKIQLPFGIELPPLSTIKKKIGEWLDKVIEPFEAFFSIDAWKEFGKDIWNGIVGGLPTWSGIKQELKENLVDPFINGFKDLFGIHSPSTVMKELGGYLVEGLFGGLGNLASGLQGIFQKAWGGIQGVAGKIAGAWDGIKNKTATLTTKVKEKSKKVFEKVKSGWETVKTKASTLKANVKNLAQNTFDKVVDGWNTITNKKSTLKTEVVQTAGEKIKAVQEMWNAISNSSVTKEIKGKIGNGWGNIQNAWNAFQEVFATKTIKGDKDKTWNDTKNAWDGIKDGEKATKTIKGDGQKGSSWTEMLKAWNSVKDKVSATKTIKGTGQNSDAWKNMVNAWKSIKNKTAKVGVDVDKDSKKALDDLKKKIGSLPTTVLKIAFEKNSKEALEKFLKLGGFNSNTKTPTITPNPGSIRTKKDGGIFYSGNWHPITTYAGGGIPDMGQMFIAREAGPELVGTIGNHTAVVNNDQIVASVSDGVFNALAPVLTQMINTMNNMNRNGTPLYVEGVSEGDIVKITTEANNIHKKRYGTPLYT